MLLGVIGGLIIWGGIIALLIWANHRLDLWLHKSGAVKTPTFPTDDA